MPVKIKIKTKRQKVLFDRLKKRMKETSNRAVDVGFPENGKLMKGRKTPKGDTGAKDYSELVNIAAVNHFGTKDGRIPPRPFMTVAMRGKHLERIQRVVTKEIGLLTKPNSFRNVDVSFDTIGLVAQVQHKAAIRELTTPPNAPETIARKGSSNPLIENGVLINSVQFVKTKGLL